VNAAALKVRRPTAQRCRKRKRARFSAGPLALTQVSRRTHEAQAPRAAQPSAFAVGQQSAAAFGQPSHPSHPSQPGQPGQSSQQPGGQLSQSTQPAQGAALLARAWPEGATASARPAAPMARKRNEISERFMIELLWFVLIQGNTAAPREAAIRSAFADATNSEL
jgi:hypothetical protein